MIQHAGRQAEMQGAERGWGIRRLCLPRGLESCRYGGAVGVTFSELGADSSGERSSIPSEAMSVAVINDGKHLAAAASLPWAQRGGGGDCSPAAVAVGAELLRSCSRGDEGRLEEEELRGDDLPSPRVSELTALEFGLKNKSRNVLDLSL
ncbi:hypothetical protein AMECASPLE_035946 [Ameca splendens]|uniref:Uncharacterized protein n=1 Tax=Ameca splendens TaxID=208324 RepID=A0ABV0Y7C8_9TELE